MSTGEERAAVEPLAAPDAPRARVLPHAWVLAALFLVYVVTRYPDVGGRVNMGDSAKFQFLARTLGVGHSPGNPLYLMLTALWVRIPLPLADATKVTLFSGVCAIATVALASRAVAVLGFPPILRRPVVVEARTFAAVLLGLGSLFWTLATEAEVYTLGSVFVAGVVLGMAGWTTHRRPRALALAVACLGLAIANHLTIVALGPAVLVVLLREREGRAALRSLWLWGVALGAAAVGALAYGWIAWRAAHGPLPYSELPSPLDAKAFVRFVTGQGVADATYAKATIVSAFRERLPGILAQLEKQWAWPLLAFLPLGALQLLRERAAFATFALLGAAGHLVLAFVFRIPDPEGLFVPVSVLLVALLARAPSAVAAFAAEARRERVAAGAALTMLVLHGALALAHGVEWYTHPFAAYVQQTPEGRVVLDLPTLADALPERAMVAVPCGHYGCVEVTAYYALVDPALRQKGATFVRFSWSEWNDEKLPVPVVDPKRRQDRPICVLLSNDLARLKELGLAPTAIPRAPVRVLGRRFVSAPLECVMPGDVGSKP